MAINNLKARLNKLNRVRSIKVIDNLEHSWEEQLETPEQIREWEIACMQIRASNGCQQSLAKITALGLKPATKPRPEEVLW